MITRRQTVTATNILNGDNKPVTLASHLLQAFKRSPPHPQGVCPRKRFRRKLYRVTRSLGTNSPPNPHGWRPRGLIPCSQHPLKMPCGSCSHCPGSELQADGPAPVWNTVGLRIEQAEETRQSPTLASEDPGGDGSIISSRVD